MEESFKPSTNFFDVTFSRRGQKNPRRPIFNLSSRRFFENHRNILEIYQESIIKIFVLKKEKTYLKVKRYPECHESSNPKRRKTSGTWKLLRISRKEILYTIILYTRISCARNFKKILCACAAQCYKII